MGAADADGADEDFVGGAADSAVAGGAVGHGETAGGRMTND
jgi:hypothetical protein